MARGRKAALTLDEQLAKITTEIENMETSLKELKVTKKGFRRTDQNGSFIRIGRADIF